MSDQAKKVEVEIAKPITLEESFDIVLNKLKKLEQGMVTSDREVYRAVGEFTDSTVTFAQNMINVVLSPEGKSPESVLNNQYQIDLCKRFELLRNEADLLLLSANSNEEIDRVLKLEQLLDRITSRINALSTDETIKPQDALQEDDLKNLSVTDLKAIAKERKLKNYTKLKKSELIALLSQ
jgi:hypothetical protein